MIGTGFQNAGCIQKAVIATHGLVDGNDILVFDQRVCRYFNAKAAIAIRAANIRTLEGIGSETVGTIGTIEQNSSGRFSGIFYLQLGPAFYVKFAFPGHGTIYIILHLAIAVAIGHQRGAFRDLVFAAKEKVTAGISNDAVFAA